MTLRRALTAVVLLAVALVALAPAQASAAIEILSRGIVPDPPIEGSKSSITVEVRVDYAPFRVEFSCCDPANAAAPKQTLVFDEASPLTQYTAGTFRFEFDPGAAGAQQQVTVRIVDALGVSRTQSFPLQVPLRPLPPPPPPPSPQPGGPTASGDCPTSVEFGVIEARTQGGGCWQRSTNGGTRLTRNGVTIDPAAGFFETADRFILNGIPFPAAPPGSKYVLVEPTSSAPGGRIGIDRGITVRLGPVTVLDRPFVFDLPEGAPAGGARVEGALPPFTIPEGLLGGLRIGGSVQVVLGRDGARNFASFPISVTLPAVITPSPGTVGAVTGTTEITTDDTRGVSLDGGKIEVQNVAIGKLGIERLCVSYLSAGVSSQFAACEPPSLNGAPVINCSPATSGVERFDGSAVIVLPTQSETKLGAFVGLAGGQFRYAGAFVDDAGIPLIQGLNLERLGFAICVDPLALRGDAGLSVAGGLIRGDVSVLYQDVPGRGFFVEAQGFVRIATIPIGNGRVRVSSTGAVDFDAQASINLANGFLTLDGRVAGVFVPRPTFRFQVEGSVSACIANRFLCAGATGIVSNIGVSGCVTLGFIKFSGFFPFDGSRRVDGFGCGFQDRARVFRAQSLREAATGVSFTVPQASPQYVAHVQGQDGPPKVRVTGPSGTAFTSGPGEATSDQRLFLITENPEAKETSIFLAANAAPGEWTVEALPGSTPLTGVVETQEAERRPTVVAATLSAKGERRVADVRYAVAEGQWVRLDVIGDGYQQTIAQRLAGGACPAGTTAPGRTPAESRCQTITFTPTFGYQGERRLQATVYDPQGRIIEIVDVAGFQAPAPPIPTRPPDVRLVRKADSVIAVWGRSKRLVSRYGAYAVLSDGRRIGFTGPAGCLAWRIKKVAPTTSVRFRVQAGRRDLAFGAAGSLVLKGGQRYAGPKALARARTPRTCPSSVS